MITGRTSLDDELDDRGFARFGFLTGAEVEGATQIASTLAIDPASGFYASNVHAARHQAAAARDRLLDLVSRAVDRTLPGRRAVKAVVLAKGPVGDNWVGVHQDWDYVDERHHRGHVLWCPLVDTRAIDGLLHVIPGSHRWLDNRRGSGAFPLPFQRHEEALRRIGVAADTAAGEAVMYDNAALHFSPPNDGVALRLVLGLVVVPDDATIVHLHSTDGATADLFEVDPATFTNRPFGERPEGFPVDRIPVGPATIDEDALGALIARPH